MLTHTFPPLILAVLASVSLASFAVAAPILETSVESSTYALSDVKTGPPPTQITSAFNHVAQSNTLNASASADVGGHSAAKVEGSFASPAFGINNAIAIARLTYSTTNTTGAAADFFFTFSILGPRLEIRDSSQAGLNMHSVGAPDASYTAQIQVNGDPIWRSFAELYGGRNGHLLFEEDTDLGGTRYGTGGLIGYQFSNYGNTLPLGTFANGETITVEAVLQVDLSSAWLDLGALAQIGDPNALGTTGGFSGDFSNVPEPATATLLLIGFAFAGMRRPHFQVGRKSA